MKHFTAPDGTTWGVLAQSPGASNAMILFRHPDGASSRRDRYNWMLNQGPEARSVTARVDADRMLDQLAPTELARLFSRSMPVSRPSSFNHGPDSETA